jgi:chemotaxis response regulator CheB
MAVVNRRIRVLCVDDHRLIREGVARIVGVQPDMEVIAEASNGEHAVAQFIASRPDVTLMDLQLPFTSGAEATRRIREVDAAARIIVLTMYHGGRGHPPSLRGRCHGLRAEGCDLRRPDSRHPRGARRRRVS